MQMMFLLMTVGYSRAHIRLVMVSTVTSLRTGLMPVALSVGLPHPLALQSTLARASDTSE